MFNRFILHLQKLTGLHVKLLLNKSCLNRIRAEEIMEAMRPTATCDFNILIIVGQLL